MNSFMLAAAVLSAIAFLLHLFAGGREIAVPLLQATDLNPMPKYVVYYCWHLVTIAIAAVAIMFAIAGFRSQSMDLGWMATALTASFCLLGLAIPPMKKQSYKNMPQGWLFLPIFLLGIAGGVT